MHMCVRARVLSCVYACVRACMCSLVCVCMCACMHVCSCVCMYVCMRALVCVCMCACVHACSNVVRCIHRYRLLWHGHACIGVRVCACAWAALFNSQLGQRMAPSHSSVCLRRSLQKPAGSVHGPFTLLYAWAALQKPAGQSILAVPLLLSVWVPGLVNRCCTAQCPMLQPSTPAPLIASWATTPCFHPFACQAWFKGVALPQCPMLQPPVPAPLCFRSSSRASWTSGWPSSTPTLPCQTTQRSRRQTLKRSRCWTLCAAPPARTSTWCAHSWQAYAAAVAWAQFVYMCACLNMGLSARASMCWGGTKRGSWFCLDAFTLWLQTQAHALATQAHAHVHSKLELTLT